MALSPTVVAGLFLIAVVSALLAMAYMVWRDSKPSDFFTEAVSESYDLELAEAEINAYYELKEKLQEQYAPESLNDDGEAEEPTNGEAKPPWSRKVPQEERGNLQKALLRRLIACVDKLDKVQRDKPGNWKLWQTKLVSEHYWSSLCDAEKMVSQEIESCIAEAEEIEPGWREHIFLQAVQHWRMQKQQDNEKKMAKKAVEQEKKQAIKEVKKQEVDARKEIEDKIRQEKLAQKAMEKLLAEEEKAEAAKAKTKGKAATPAPKSKSKKK